MLIGLVTTTKPKWKSCLQPFFALVMLFTMLGVRSFEDLSSNPLLHSLPLKLSTLPCPLHPGKLSHWWTCSLSYATMESQSHLSGGTSTANFLRIMPHALKSLKSQSCDPKLNISPFVCIISVIKVTLPFYTSLPKNKSLTSLPKPLPRHQFIYLRFKLMGW